MKKAALILAFIMVLTLIPFSATVVADETHLIWAMTDEDIQAFLDDPESSLFLRPAQADGRPVYSFGPDGGLLVANRNQDWQSVDITDDWMEEGEVYTIVVDFRAREPVLFRIMNTDSPYGNLAMTGEPDTYGTVVLVTGIVEGQRGVRLTLPAGVYENFTIASIRIYEGDVSGDVGAAIWKIDVPSLRELFADYFLFGNIMEPGILDDSGTVEMFLHHYNSVTVENSMKPENIAPARGEWNFAGTHRLIDWAEEHDINVHGHTLVWHSQSPPWLNENEDGTPLTRAQARSNMEYFINTYVGEFAGRVATWDVVNEAFTDSVDDNAPGSSWRDNLRTNSPWFLAYANEMDEEAGEHPSDYIYDAFVFARLADPSARLVYNDFNEEQQSKREAIAAMTEEFNARWLEDPRNDDPDRLLIEVLGMQAHYWTDWLAISDVRATIERFAATGARVAITELDISLGQWNAFAPRTFENLHNQAMLYGQLFELFVELSDYIDSVTIWGRADHQSWRAQGFPLLYDGRLEPKPAFWNVVEVIDPEAAALGRPQVEPPEPEETPEPEQETTPDPTPTPEATPTPEPEETPEPEQESEPDDFPWVVVIIIAAVVVIGVVVTIVVIKRKKQ